MNRTPARSPTLRRLLNALSDHEHLSLAAKSKIRQAVFARLRIRVRVATANLVEIGFSPREERIARIHHYGQMDQVSPHLRVRYPIQQALGITPSDSEVLTSAIYSHLARE